MSDATLAKVESPRPRFWSRRAPSRTGFSLVEVVLALGIVCFAVVPMVALLPIGLQTARDSMDQTVTSSIAQQIRGDLEQISFGASPSISDLSKQTNYYTDEGIATTQGDPANYYQATFVVSTSAGGTSTGTTAGGATFADANARMVTVTVGYPASIPPAAQKKIIIPLFLARQTSVN